MSAAGCFGLIPRQAYLRGRRSFVESEWSRARILLSIHCRHRGCDNRVILGRSLTSASYNRAGPCGLDGALRGGSVAVVR
jgi:hypothetical protein